MVEPLTLVIDQGTHATRAFAFDEEGGVRASAQCKIRLARHGSDRVEQDPDEIIASVQKVLQEVLADVEVRRLGLARAGLATQRSSVAAWDRQTGLPFGPSLSWLDRREAKELKRFDSHAERIMERTGLPLSPHYGASKLRWYMDHIPAVGRAHREGRLAMGPLASFVLFHLLRERPCMVDHANASRTQLWNLGTSDWDPWLLDLFGVPRNALPCCKPIRHDYGFLREVEIPLSIVNGDQTSAIYCLGQPRKDTAIVNIGTGAFILLPTGTRLVRLPALLSGLACSSKDQSEYVVEGTVNGAGSALDWAARQWNIPDIFQHLPSWLSREEEPPLFINTIGGLGSPWWQPGPTAFLKGEGEPWQKAVALVESIVFLLQANLEILDQTGVKIRRLQVGGSLARLEGLCQRMADLARREVHCPAETEASARGTAYLAAGRPAHWPPPGPGRSYQPKNNPGLALRYTRFCEVLHRTPGK